MLIPRPYQEECLNKMFHVKQGNYLIQLATGLGKALDKNSNVLTDKGFVKISDLKLSDKIFGEDGKLYNVLGIYPQGKRELYKVTFSDNSNVICDKNHLWNYQTKSMRGHNINYFKTDSLDNIMKIPLKITGQGNNVYIPMSKPINFSSCNVKINPYILGLLLGDGSFRNNIISFSNSENDLIEVITNNFESRIDNSKSCPSIYIKNKELKTQLKSYKLYDLYSHEKFIPKEYLINDISVRLNVLSGLIDTDGECNGSYYTFSSTSKQLSEDVKFLVESLGGTCTFNIRQTKYTYNDIKQNGKVSYRLNIKLPYDIKPFKSNKHNKEFKEGQASSRRYIKNIEYYGLDDAICIKSSNPTELFLTNNFIVTHNTVIFTNYINNNKEMNILILSHREELVNQPVKYIVDKVGIENGSNTSNGERVISASVQSLHRRLDKFPKDYFDVIITDECHHSISKTYQKIYDYFNFKLHFGFTATPNRFDMVRLDKTFDEILYQKDLIWGIKNNYLVNVECKRFYINYDLKNVRSSNGDFNIEELEKLVNTVENAQAIARIYNNHAVGRTLIFSVSVAHAYSIQKEIKDSIVIDANTKNRDVIIKDFTSGKISCLINCMIFTEGTDIPLIETIIIARPTKNTSLYTQMVGRGLRLGKDKLNLIDCCGVTNLNICSAPTLLGLDIIDKPKKAMTRDMMIQGDLFDLGEKIIKKEDHPDNWKINHKIIKLFSKKNNLDLRDINFIKFPNGNLKIFNKVIEFKADTNMQEEIDKVYKWLIDEMMDKIQLWSLTKCKAWGRKEASQKQKNLINRMLQNYDTSNLNMLEANQILGRLLK